MRQRRTRLTSSSRTRSERLSRASLLTAVEAAAAVLLGLTFVSGLYGDSLWLGILLLSAGAIGCWLALHLHRLKQRGDEVRSVPAEPDGSATAIAIPGRRTYPVFIGVGFFLIGTLAEDVPVGIMLGLAGLAFGYLATAQTGSRRGRRGAQPPADSAD